MEHGVYGNSICRYDVLDFFGGESAKFLFSSPLSLAKVGLVALCCMHQLSRRHFLPWVNFKTVS